MSTPATAPQPISQHNVTIVAQEHHGEFHQHIQQRIAERAYQLFEIGGHADGKHQSHWLQAESELFERVPEIHETGNWLSASVTRADPDASGLQVLVERDRAIVAGARPALGDGVAFLLIKWPASIDPATAAAYLKGNTLTVTAKHTATQSDSTAYSAHGTQSSSEIALAKPHAPAGPSSASAPEPQAGKEL
jgi:hypothetical protein